MHCVFASLTPVGSRGDGKMILDVMLEMLFVLVGILMVSLIYSRVASKYKQPEGCFNDAMSYYMWRSKRRKAQLSRNRVRAVKSHEARQRSQVLDGKISDKVKDVAGNIEVKAKKVAKNLGENKGINKIKDDIGNLKKELSNMQTNLAAKQSQPDTKRIKMISQLREVYAK